MGLTWVIPWNPHLDLFLRDSKIKTLWNIMKVRKTVDLVAHRYRFNITSRRWRVRFGLDNSAVPSLKLQQRLRCWNRKIFLNTLSEIWETNHSINNLYHEVCKQNFSQTTIFPTYNLLSVFFQFSNFSLTLKRIKQFESHKKVKLIYISCYSKKTYLWNIQVTSNFTGGRRNLQG